MLHTTIFSATLGLSYPWTITEVNLDQGQKRLDIRVDFHTDSTFACPVCGQEREVCGTVCETWQHDDFFNYTALLHARVPRITCPTCGIGHVKLPWTRNGSKFTLLR